MLYAYPHHSPHHSSLFGSRFHLFFSFVLHWLLLKPIPNVGSIISVAHDHWHIFELWRVVLLYYHDSYRRSRCESEGREAERIELGTMSLATTNSVGSEWMFIPNVQ